MPYVHDPPIWRTHPVSLPAAWTHGGIRDTQNVTVSDLDERTQYGYRGTRYPGPPPDSLKKPNGTWSQRLSEEMAEERAVRATTPSPLVRTSSRPVYDRTYHARTITPGFGVGGEHKIGANDALELVAGSGFVNGIGISNINVPRLSDEERADYVDRLSSALKASRPTRPDVSLAQFVIELRDVRRLFDHMYNVVVQHRLRFGETYLAGQFGYKPLANDIAKGANAVLEADKKISQFLRDSGQLVRRSITLPSESTSSSTTLVHNASNEVRASSHAYYRPSTRAQFETVERTRSVRAFALWEYFVGDPQGFASRRSSYVDGARRLLGTNLTPAVVWEVSPWSWMVDWFIDIGGLLAYQQDVADYSLAMRRGGYVVETTTTITRKYRTTWSGSGVPARSVDYAVQAKIHDYSRRSAPSPVGLDVEWDGLNSFQTSILLALGLQKKGM